MADDPRRLALVVPGALDTPTGGYAYDRRMVAELERLGWRVDVRVLDGGFPFPDAAALERAAACLADLPDGALVLADGLAFGAMPAAAAHHRDRLALVALVHHPLALETGLDAATAARLADSERAALASARAVVVTSRATAAQLAAFDVPPTRITVVEPGTDPAAAARGTRRLDPSAPVQLLCVASLVPRKGHALLLDALARLDDLPWTLTCVGSQHLDAGEAERVTTRAQSLGLASRVRFTGAAAGAALDRAYDDADVFVLPSYYEGYGMAVAEAVARGLPVVCSATGAQAELVDDRSGRLVPPGDLPALTAALRAVIGDDGLRLRLAAGAAARAAAVTTWAQAAARLETALVTARAGRGDLQR